MSNKRPTSRTKPQHYSKTYVEDLMSGPLQGSLQAPELDIRQPSKTRQTANRQPSKPPASKQSRSILREPKSTIFVTCTKPMSPSREYRGPPKAPSSYTWIRGNDLGETGVANGLANKDPAFDLGGGQPLRGRYTRPIRATTREDGEVDGYQAVNSRRNPETRDIHLAHTAHGLSKDYPLVQRAQRDGSDFIIPVA